MMRALVILMCLGGVAAAQEIKVEGTLGTLDDAAVRLVVEEHAAALESCFTEGAGKLRYVGGAARLRLRVARDGTVKRAAAVSDLGSWPVERCLLERARGFRFARPRGGEAEVELPVELPARVAPVAGDGSELRGKLRALAACSSAPARVEVVAYVGPGGRVTSAGFSSDEPLSTSWADCAAQRARGLRLSDPRGKVVKVSAEVVR